MIVGLFCSGLRCLGLAAAVCLVTACGGQTDSEESSGGGAHGSGASGNGGNGSGDQGNSTELPACVKGWEPGSQSTYCPWLASDGFCYAEKMDACACICPRDHDSTCQSGLPGGGPSARTSVICY
jgi:hypothetical protein